MRTAQNPGRFNEEQALTVQITVTAHITTAETVVEYWGGFQHNRVNVGESLDRWLTPAEDFNALFEIDMGTAVSEGRHGYVLHAYSIDRAPRSTDVIWVNGTRLEVEHRRRAAVSDGRYAVYLGQPGWSIPNLSSWTIPDELITDGLNTFSIVLEGDLYVYGAYVSSYSYVEPDPDPDPDPCPDCPVAS